MKKYYSLIKLSNSKILFYKTVMSEYKNRMVYYTYNYFDRNLLRWKIKI